MRRLALPVQTASVLNAMAWNERICGTAPLAEPATRTLLHCAYAWGAALHFTLVPGPPDALQPQQECTVVLSFAQLSLGLALPAVAQLVAETALFQQHQRQRRRRGLPPEGGPQAALYHWAAELAAVDGPAVVVCLWMLLGVLWDVALALVARGAL